jgi:hypothetical protein
MNLRRVTTVLSCRQLDAASGARRWPSAAIASQSADALASGAVLGVLGRKVTCFVEKLTNLIGEGAGGRSTSTDRAVSRTLESAWSRLDPWVDVEGGDLVSGLNRVAGALATESEAFVSLLVVGVGELRPQILPVAQVNTNLNEELRGGGSNVDP